MDSGIEYSRKINDHDVDLTIFTKTNLPKPNEIGAATPDYVDQQIALITETGIPKLSRTPLPLLVAEEGQTEFNIEMETFDKVTDSVDVYKGHLHLQEGADFTVNEKTITLVEGVPEGTTIAITVLKNVPLGEDGSVSGTVISPKTLPVKALEDGALEKLGGASKTYVEQLVATITETGIPKLNVNAFELVAEADGQRLFNINMDTFDAVTDTVLVLDGRGLLLPNSDYTVSGRTITVSEGWNAGDIGGYIVLKNVPMGSDGSVSGAVITPNTLPLDRLAEMPTASDVGALTLIDAKSSSFDMTAILKSGVHFAMYECGSTTLGTPHEQGITTLNTAKILSFASSVNYGFQIAFVSGFKRPYTRTLNNGTVADWEEMITPDSINAMSIKNELTSEDLNTVVKEGFYFGRNANTCTNKPPNTKQHFGLLVMRNGGTTGYVTQQYISNTGVIYYREIDGSTCGEWLSPAMCSVPMTFSINENGGLSITY